MLVVGEIIIIIIIFFALGVAINILMSPIIAKLIKIIIRKKEKNEKIINKIISKK